MVDWILGHELLLRGGSFLTVFLVMALWELAAERRHRVVGRAGRWIANLSLVTVNSVLVRLVFPAAAVGGALTAAELEWGVLNVFPAPYWMKVVLSVFVLDLAVYLQHVLFHTVPILWRLHMIHHADLDVDVTSGIRFHTLEILLSLPIKLVVVFALGAPALSVLIFEILLNATAVFNHSNVRIGERVDRWLRLVLVTPDMHRVHHSTERVECNSNFGFNLPWWDRLFATYRGQPRAGHEGMTLGVSHLLGARKQSLFWLLATPFVSKSGGYPISRGPEPS